MRLELLRELKCNEDFVAIAKDLSHRRKCSHDTIRRLEEDTSFAHVTDRDELIFPIGVCLREVAAEVIRLGGKATGREPYSDRAGSRKGLDSDSLLLSFLNETVTWVGDSWRASIRDKSHPQADLHRPDQSRDPELFIELVEA